MGTPAIARSIFVTGKVQGVFFREWTVGVARELSIAGWVRNRRDGTVEVFAVGEAEAIDRFIERLRVGSPASRVDHLRVEESPFEQIEGFVRKPST
jgi:acylphosphatase